MIKKLQAALLLFSVGSLCFAGKPKVPDQVLSAKNVFIIARTGVAGNGKVTPNAERAKAQVEEELSKWGRYTAVDDPQKADLVFIITEANTGSVGEAEKSRFGTFTSSNIDILTDNLSIYPAGKLEQSTPALWKRNESNEDGGWPAKRCIEHFRRDVLDAERQKIK